MNHLGFSWFAKGFDKPYKTTIRVDKNQRIDFKSLSCKLNGRFRAANGNLPHSAVKV